MSEEIASATGTSLFAPMSRSFSDSPPVSRYAERVKACWRGKAIGGSLGQSFEGLEGPVEADYYYPEPDGMVPNDDLDVQVAYAEILMQMSRPRIDRMLIAEAWKKHIRFPWNEYGVAKRNLAEGILPPFTGSFDNWFRNGEGAVIRSELWACLAPGDPLRAAAYAYEDACFDHSDDGVWAAVFMAALQSYAFVESDVNVLLDRVSELIPNESGIRQVILDTREWVGIGSSWTDAMSLIRTKYGSDDFTDTRMNTAFVLLGWLYAGGDFERGILITNGCGGDTDSSTASLAALMAIIDPDCIPERWMRPIGDGLVLHSEIVGIRPPTTVTEFTSQVVELRRRLAGVWPEPSKSTFDAEKFRIPVTIGWASPFGQPWGTRDVSGLSPAFSPEAKLPVDAAKTSVPGTWVRWHRQDFLDRILIIEYTIELDHTVAGQLMFDCSENTRVWLDGTYALGSLPAPIFPTQHRPAPSRGIQVRLETGRHRVRAMILRPPAERPWAEWVVGLAESPRYEWVPGVFRASHD